MTAEELYDLPDSEDREELVRGSVVREPPASYGHGVAEGRIYYLLEDWVRSRGRSSGGAEAVPGQVACEAGFVLARDPDTVRSPDVAFVSARRIEEGTSKGPYFEGAPDLAVEIVSPANTAREMTEKVGEYLRAGTRRVWVVDRRAREVTVHRRGAPAERLGSRETLDGGEVLPGFAVTVDELFR